MADERARLESACDGRVAVIALAAPKANILDRAMLADIAGHLARLEGRTDLAAIVIKADGSHFSYGASVEEHLPPAIEQTLGALHGVLRQLIDAPAPTMAAVRGRCLGGGFELVLACDLVLAEDEAQFACPEITLGVFPPAASALLPVRVGTGRAAALTITGAPISARDAAAAGLVARLVPTGTLDAALDAWLAESFLPRSAPALRCTSIAVRHEARYAVNEILPALERLYLQDLMSQPDAEEGIRAFLEKRSPRWRAAVSATELTP